MAINILELFATLAMDASNFDRSLVQAQRQADKFKINIEKIMSAIGKATAVGLGAAATGVGAMIKQATSSYGEYEQLAGGAKKIFENMDFSQIEKDAKEAYKDLNMSASQYLEAINLAGSSFAQTMGDKKGYETARKGMKAIADYASGTGKNINELNQKYQMISRSASVYQSIADQFSGILPQTSADFLKQAQSAGFLEKKYKKLTEVPVAEYQEAVTKMIEKGVGSLGLLGNTAKESTETLTGSLAMTKAAWNNLLTGMADPNADFGKLMDNLIESGSAALGNITPIVERAFKSLGNFISKAAPTISKELPKLVKLLLPDLINTAYDLLVGLADALPGLFPVLVDTVWQLFNEIADKMGEKFPVLEPVFDILKSALSLIAAVGDSAGAALKAIWDNFLKYVVEFYGNVFMEFMKGFADVLDRVSKSQAAVAILTTIIGLITSLTAGIKAYHAVMTVVQTIQTAVATSGGILNAIWAANPVGVIVVALGALIAVIVEVITYWDYLVLIWEESGKQWKKWLGDIAKWFSDTWNGIVNGYWWFIDRIVEGAEKIIGYWKDGCQKIGDFFTNLWNNIVSTFTSIGTKVGDAIGGAFKTAINAVIWTVEGALNAIPNAINGMIDTINNLPGVSISAIPTVTLPRLAQGGVLKKGQVGYLEGDGDEAVVPLSQNTEWIDRVADKISEKSGNSATYIFNFNIDNVSGNREDMEDNADLLMQIFTEKMSRRGVVFA